MANLSSGKILIADPFLKDPNFMRTAVFLCDHQDEGSIGFIMNRRYNKTAGELILDLEGCDFPVYFGGPVQTDTIHFLHQSPQFITGGIEVTDGIYWGGEFEEVVEAINLGKLTSQMIRFYLGYSGWGDGQLNGEMKENSWLVTDGNKRLVFFPDENQIWREALKQLGGEYEQLVNYPIDPQLN